MLQQKTVSTERLQPGCSFSVAITSWTRST